MKKKEREINQPELAYLLLSIESLRNDRFIKLYVVAQRAQTLMNLRYVFSRLSRVILKSSAY